MRTFATADAEAVHGLLRAVFDDEEPDFSAWWAARASDPGFDPALVFCVVDRNGTLAAVAWCWASGFLKDLAVARPARRNGLAEGLCNHVFAAFRTRGHQHVDLKTNTVLNADAYRLYRRLGMVEVAWDG